MRVIDWARLDGLWGSRSDADLGALVGCDATTVGAYRRRKDIAACPSARRRFPWASVHGLLGTVPDAEVAERLGCSLDAVKRYRRQHRIAGYHPPDGSERWLAVRPLLGKLPDAEVAEQMGIESASVKRYRWRHNIPREGCTAGRLPARLTRLLVGRIPDPVAARLLGCTPATIRGHRRRLRCDCRPLPGWSAPTFAAEAVRLDLAGAVGAMVRDGRAEEATRILSALLGAPASLVEALRRVSQEALAAEGEALLSAGASQKIPAWMVSANCTLQAVSVITPVPTSTLQSSEIR